jgi:hypothetical protein
MRFEHSGDLAMEEQVGATIRAFGCSTLLRTCGNTLLLKRNSRRHILLWEVLLQVSFLTCMTDDSCT